MLPEREAKTIVAQVVSGLQYLNTKPHSIIHYDLKPANILFDSLGECKLTVRAALRWAGFGLGCHWAGLPGAAWCLARGPGA